MNTNRIRVTKKENLFQTPKIPVYSRLFVVFYLSLSL